MLQIAFLEENYARLGMKHFNIFGIRKNNGVLSLELWWQLGEPSVTGFIQGQAALLEWLCVSGEISTS